MKADVPVAEVVQLGRKSARVLCPYCGKQHHHSLVQHGKQWFAPKCGMNLNPEQRATGYRFDTIKETK